MARRKTDPELSELVESVLQGLDLRYSIDKKAKEAILAMEARGDYKNLSALRSMKIKLGTNRVTDIRYLQEVGYERNVEDIACECGNGLSEVAFHFRYGPRMKDRVKKRRATGSDIILGKNHRKTFTKMLEEWGDGTLRRQITEGPRQQEEKLEDLLTKLPASLMKRLRMLGVDVEQLGKILSLQHAYALLHGDETGLRYDMDPGTGRNTFNWFRLGIEEGQIDNEEVEDIWYRMRDAAHLVEEHELVTLMQYSFEHRYRNTNAVLSHVKDDLLFLGGLSKDHKWVKKYGKIDIDKKYELPETRFRPEKDFSRKKKRTIRDVLGQMMITTTEAIGIHQHFKDIKQIRERINRETTQRYGVGRTWDYLLRDIKPEFEEVKAELHEDFERGQKIRDIYKLTKGDYKTLRTFFEASEVGDRSQRRNYLMNYSIEQFLEVAPKIVAIGRKIRYAQKAKDEGWGDKEALMRQDFVAIEDVRDEFEEYTGIKDSSLDEVLDLIANANLGGKTYGKCQEELERMREYGIIESKYLRQEGYQSIKWAYDKVVDAGIEKLTEEQEKAQELLRRQYEEHGIYYEASYSPGLRRSRDVFDIEDALEMEYGDKSERNRLGSVADSVERLVKRLRKGKKFTFKQLQEDKEKAEESYGKQVLMNRGEVRPDLQCAKFDADYLTARYEDPLSPWNIKYFDPEKTKEYAGLQKMTDEQLEMAKAIASYDVTNKLNFGLSGLTLQEEVWATEDVLELIQTIYETALKKGLIKQDDREFSDISE
ncbi:MAG: hypothetical protein ABIE94_03100 [archaeon]